MTYLKSRTSKNKLFWKYAANLQKNIHTEMFFNFVKIMLIQISKQINICINSRIEINFFTFILIIYRGLEEHLFSRT